MEKTIFVMDLNRETAMRLWSKTYGKQTRVKDFAGREIAKGAYNDRNSEFGWNVDHILPQSKGGKTADHNLVCCHILTNDEKADRFPCFKANGKRFEIVKVENHYEIQSAARTEKTTKEKEEDPDKINFYDSASGIKLFKRLKGIQNKPRFVGTVFIRLNGIANTAVIDFIERCFDEENISYSMKRNYCASEITVIAKNYNMQTKDDISKLLDKCVLMNTYLGHYFVPSNNLKEYDVYYRVDYYKEKTAMFVESQTVDIDAQRSAFDTNVHIRNMEYVYYHNSLFISELVYDNTDASLKAEKSSGQYTEYDVVFKRLSENLDKEVNKK